MYLIVLKKSRRFEMVIVIDDLGRKGRKVFCFYTYVFYVFLCIHLSFRFERSFYEIGLDAWMAWYRMQMSATAGTWDAHQFKFFQTMKPIPKLQPSFQRHSHYPITVLALHKERLYKYSISNPSLHVAPAQIVPKSDPNPRSPTNPSSPLHLSLYQPSTHLPFYLFKHPLI